MPQDINFESPTAFEGQVITDKSTIIRGILQETYAGNPVPIYEEEGMVEIADENPDRIPLRILIAGYTDLRYGRLVSYTYTNPLPLDIDEATVKLNLQQAERLRILTYPRELDIKQQALAGVVILSSLPSGSNKYPDKIKSGEKVSVLVRGLVWVRVSKRVNAGEKATFKKHVPSRGFLNPELIATEEAGRIEPASYGGDEYLIIPKAFFVKTTRDAGMAILYVDFSGQTFEHPSDF